VGLNRQHSLSFDIVLGIASLNQNKKFSWQEKKDSMQLCVVVFSFRLTIYLYLTLNVNYIIFILH